MGDLLKIQTGRIAVAVVAGVVLLNGTVWAQLSASAYRVLGQPDLRQNGLNRVSGAELHSPGGLALDARGGQVHLYVSDTYNSRILAWSDVGSYQTGAPADLVLGQPGPQYTNPMGTGSDGLNSPLGLAVDPTNGNLYVADYGNNRVLRFPAPFANPTRVEPDALYGQPGFTTTYSSVSKSSLYQPRAVAFDSAGNLWVADGGNCRVVRFNAAVLNNQTPPDEDVVIGQTGFSTGSANGGVAVSASGFYVPAGLAFDAKDNLYVSDSGNARVLMFPAPAASATAATAVWGQKDFTSSGAPSQATNSSLAGPLGLSIDNAGNLYVAVPHDNRVLVFSTSKSATAAQTVLGQADLTTTTANTGAFPMASSGVLYGASDVRVDANGRVFVADSSNNRVLEFAAGAKAASQVWGQADFASNSVNQIKPGSIGAPYKIAIDYSQAPFAIYVSDRYNNRVLGWKDSAHFHNGDPADIVIGQPGFATGAANIDTQGSATPSKTSLSAPMGLAIDPGNGSLYVSDSGNNRVLRYPRPVDQTGRITPDLVIGQTGFTSSVSAVISASTLHTPAGLALGPNGDLFVADAGNNRVLEFAPVSGNGPAALRVYGQTNMTTGAAPKQLSSQTLSAPLGVFVDSAYYLYVADTSANRVLIFPNTQGASTAGAAAAYVIGQGSFTSTSGGVGSNLYSPSDVSLDSVGNIYVADTGYNRVLVFAAVSTLPPTTGATASSVIGQTNIYYSSINWDSPDGLATAEGLHSPIGVYVDRQDTLYVGDGGNNRVLQFLKSASVVNAATFQAGVPVAAGGLATLFGSGLTQTTGQPSGQSWPTALAGREVVVNDSTLAPLSYAGPGQINLQVPSSTPTGTQRIAVRTADTGELLAGGSLSVAVISPGLFTNASGQAAAYNQDWTLNGATSSSCPSCRPAPKGSVVMLFGTGQGPVNPTVADGAPAPSDPLSYTVAVATTDGKTCLTAQVSTCIAIGSTFGEISYTGLAPGLVGVWQINVKIPEGALSGTVPIRVVVDGTPGNLANIAIK